MAVARLSVSPPAPSHVAPSNLSDEVELYQRTYSTLLRSSGETRLRVLESSHMAMGSSLHPLADSDEIDLGAFIYAVRRLPDVDGARSRSSSWARTRRSSAAPGIGPLEQWEAVEAPARRRRWYDSGDEVLAVLLASRVRRRRPRPDARRLPDRVEQDPPAHARRRLAAGRGRHARGVRGRARRRGRRLGAAGRRVGRALRASACRRSPTRASRCACACSAAPRSATSA